MCVYRVIDSRFGAMDNTDQSLIFAHLRGDASAFADIVRRYGPGVLAYLGRFSGSGVGAEDLFQETFKRVHEKAHTYRGGNFRAWVFAIATNVARSSLRKEKKRAFVSLDQAGSCADGNCDKQGVLEVADSSDNPLNAALKAERKQQVQAAIASLPPRQRATLILAYYQQLSYKQVAETLGCSLGTVKTQMYRALRTLADLLPDVYGDVK